jgi:hypothetical protein
VLPEAACTGATRDALGSVECVPVGDCDAPFPPAGATLFVSATGAVDATHFRSIEDAALASRSGDVIAIDDGTYHESAQLDRPVTLVGRCPEKVIMDGEGLPDPGLIVDAVATVRGLSVRHFVVAIQLSSGSGLTLEDSVLEDNTDAGIYSEGTNIQAKVARSVIRGTAPADLRTAFGIDLAHGTTLDVTDTALVANQGAGVIVTPGSKMTMRSSVIRDSSHDADGVGGYGVNGQGGDATITDSAIVGNADTGIRAYKTSAITVERTVVRGTRPGDNGRGYGMVGAEGGELTASNVVVTGTEGVGVVCSNATCALADAVVRAQKSAPDADFGDGVYAFNGSTLSLARVAILDNARTGVSVFDEGTDATFDHVYLSGTRPVPAGDMGLGVTVAFGAHAAIGSTLITSNHHTGIYLFEGGTLDLDGSAIRDTTPELAREPLGHGLLATDSKHVVIRGSEIRRSAGVGVALANTPAVIASSTIADNAVGIHVQDGSTLVQVDEAPDAPSGLEVDVTSDTVFEGNATRVGSGTIALPEPLPKL